LVNTVFVDTSAFLAALDKGDKFHPEAAKRWSALATGKTELWTTDYVRLESWSLIQRRLGAEAVMAFQDNWLPLCKIHEVGRDGFERAAAQWRIAQRRNLSLVDLTSFDAMRQLAIRIALAFDQHFQEMGYLDVQA
jgi:predicted nucleic acid-binding protein